MNVARLCGCFQFLGSAIVSHWDFLPFAFFTNEFMYYGDLIRSDAFYNTVYLFLLTYMLLYRTIIVCTFLGTIIYLINESTFKNNLVYITGVQYIFNLPLMAYSNEGEMVLLWTCLLGFFVVYYKNVILHLRSI